MRPWVIEGLERTFAKSKAIALCWAVAASPCAAQSRLEIRLDLDLSVGERQGLLLGTGLHVAVDSRGDIYVGDWMNKQVWVVSAEGRLISTVGRPGSGPGEFQAIHGTVIGRGDSLYVFDANTGRLSVFAPSDDHEFAYSFQVSSAYGRASQFFVPSDSSTGFLFAFRNQVEGTIEVHAVSADGSASEAVVLEGQNIETITAGGRGQIARTAPLYARRPVLGLAPGDLMFYGWSESIELTFYGLSGRMASEFKAASTPIRVSARDIEYELRDASELRRELLRGTPSPKTKPAVETVLVDDESRIWLDRYGVDPTMSVWWVSTRENGVGYAEFTLPDEIKIQAIRDGHAYAISTDADGFPSVQRYRIEAEVRR